VEKGIIVIESDKGDTMTKKTFFKPIDLPAPPKEKQTTDPTVPYWPSMELFAPILDKIANEIAKIQLGTSSLTEHSIMLHSGMGHNPAAILISFGKFKSEPTKNNMEEFLAMAEQDINLAAKRYFMKLLDLIIKDDKDGR
jgi:hypothetical protein